MERIENMKNQHILHLNWAVIHSNLDLRSRVDFSHFLYNFASCFPQLQFVDFSSKTQKGKELLPMIVEMKDVLDKEEFYEY